MSEWNCNIGIKGRVVRGIIGLILLALGVYLLVKQDRAFVGTGLCTLGGFAVFEAIVGWCALRAMGVRFPF